MGITSDSIEQSSESPDSPRYWSHQCPHEMLSSRGDGWPGAYVGKETSNRARRSELDPRHLHGGMRDLTPRTYLVTFTRMSRH
ncbi:hypothetical protein APTSU1_000878000 [Apodemus speciosus]|uniref:Uncharacterized protein n=1 Tax=Apodemus speciosus TaxID=105296 RepID=A0ABQ0F2P1_APOSI